MKLVNLNTLLVIFTLLVGFNGKMISQACTGSQVTLTIQNAMVTAVNKFSFELWISNTGTTTERISAYGGGIFPNIAISSGYSVSVVDQPSDLGWSMNPMTPNIVQTTNIRWTNNPNAATTSMIPNMATKIAKFEVTTAIIPASLTFATSGTQPQITAYCDGNPNSNTMTFANGKLVYGNNNAPVMIAPLPVKLHDFSAEKAGERRAKLDWNTSSEINASHFVVERSSDAENFEEIGQVNAFGYSSELKHYQFFDDKIPTLRTDAIVYYRLKMVDLDSSFEYSDIRGINFGKSNLDGIQMYPNPAVDILNIDIAGLDSKASLLILSNDGKVVLQKNIIGNGIETVDMTRFVPGLYQVIIKNQDLIHQDKIVKID